MKKALGDQKRKERREPMKQFYKASDLMEILDVSESKAYGLIRTMNTELEEKGFLICRGRVPVQYFKERFFGVADGE